jgi:putative transposase
VPVEEHIEEYLVCLAFPEESHLRRIRTTNGLERLNQEIKRRTRVVWIFPNPEACLRLVIALAVEQSGEWVHEEALPRRESEEVMLMEQ